jgi:ubiquitin C-terminal hydrolase
MISFNKNFIPNNFGLTNNGSICYFNSLLQSLISCSSFNQLVLELNITYFKNLLLASSLSSGSEILNIIKQKHIKENKFSNEIKDLTKI